MSHQDLLQQSLNLSYFYLKFRPRTKKEVINYLNKKSQKYHLTEEIINKTVEALTEQNLINDNNFIDWFVNQRNHSKQKSVFMLKIELRRFGIEKELIESFFNNNQFDEYALAEKALKQKVHLWENLDAKTRQQKATAFLLRRGFSYEVIKKVYNNYFL